VLKRLCGRAVRAAKQEATGCAHTDTDAHHTQMAALRAGLDGTPLVLIQGPPGTGKTRTILNLLSVVMHSAAKGSLELVPSVAKSAAAGPGSGGASGGSAAAAAAAAGSSSEERERLWRLQSSWMFGEPAPRDVVGPSTDTGGFNGGTAGRLAGRLACCWRGLRRALVWHTAPSPSPPVCCPPPSPLA
jgi:hypothetical protein